MNLGGSVFAETILTSTSINNNYLSGGGSADCGESQKELEINGHLVPVPVPVPVTPGYNGPVFKDHKIQTVILNYLLKEDSLKPYIIEDEGFRRNAAKSSSQITALKKYQKQKRVFVFRDEKELKNKKLGKCEVVGYADTYSKGSATLLDCLTQSVVDAGNMGGNIFLILGHNFIAGVKSSTIGLGSSGAAGFLQGGDASVYGAAVGYARSKAISETNPFMHGIVLYSENLTNTYSAIRLQSKQ